MLRNIAMLTYTDVSADPRAFTRSKLRESQLAEAAALGFGFTAWIATRANDAPEDTSEELRGFVAAVLFRRGSPMTLSLCHVAEVGDDYCVKTLFTDGSIVMTETEPQRNRFRLMLGIKPARRHGVDHAFVATTSIASLVAAHEGRVRARGSQGPRPVATHDVNTHLAISKRWREIADPRMRLQTRIATAAGIATLAAVLVTPFAASRALTEIFGEAIVQLLRIVGVLGCGPIGAAAFTFALYYVAPVLARVAPAPAMRPPHDLLKLAETVSRGYLPRPERTTAPAGRVHLPAAELARLQRIDMAISMLSALLIPLAALTSFATVGHAGAWITLSVMLTLDAVVPIVTTKTRTQLLRERFVPDLVRVETSGGCEGGTCALPKRWAVWLRLGIGVLGLLMIPKILSMPHGAVSLPAVSQWAVIGVSILVSAFTSTRKRHRQLVDSSFTPSQGANAA